MFRRDSTRQVKVGSLLIGGGAPVVIESMTNTDTSDLQATLSQINELAAAGCELVRVAVPDKGAAAVLPELTRHSPLPVVADIHFNHRLALSAVRAGVAGLRINPGNIGGEQRLAEVMSLAAVSTVSIRVGVNAGSLDKRLLQKHGSVTAEAMCESAIESIRLAERLNFRNIIVSVKASSVPLTVRAYRLLAEKTDYPLHIGVTEAGTLFSGTVYSSVGIGALLLDGLGDTLRVSLTAPPAEEVKVAKAILSAVELRKFGPRIISCPTCGRCKIDLQALAAEVERRVAGIDVPLTLAVMGCAVNGPGEAREADIGLAGGKNQGLIFCAGEVVSHVPAERLLDEFMRHLQKYLDKIRPTGVQQ